LAQYLARAQTVATEQGERAGNSNEFAYPASRTSDTG
jgi:hypothetical protein